MATYIIGAVLLLCLAFALRGMARHFRGEGSCCGGSADVLPPKKELSGSIIGKKTVHIEGMTCGHCKARVEQLLDGIDGARAEVNLHKNRATLSMTRPVADEEIRTALAGSGYTVLGIE